MDLRRTLTRRKFLISGGALLTVGVSGWAYTREFTYRNLIISVLHRKLAYMTLDEASLRTFADAFVNDYGTLGLKGEGLALSRPVFPIVDSPGTDEVTRFENRVVSKFLLSSDFFRNGADETRLITYVAYYNPYSLACANPFAVLDG
jgi:hypothetical protein